MGITKNTLLNSAYFNPIIIGFYYWINPHSPEDTTTGKNSGVKLPRYSRNSKRTIRGAYDRQ